MIYISGKMTGVKDLNYPEFNRVAKELRTLGSKVFNPAEVIINKVGLTEEEIYNKYMEEDLKGLGKCKTIYLLDGWEKSNGARIELKKALDLNLTIELQEVVLCK